MISEDNDASVKRAKEKRYQLKLYVTGMTPHSVNAIDNLRMICEEHLKGRYDLEVIDLYCQQIMMIYDSIRKSA